MSWSVCNCCQKVSRDADNGYPEDWHLVTLVGEAGEESIRLYLKLCPVCIERLPGGFKTWTQFQAYFDTRNQGSDNWLLNRKESLSATEESLKAVEESPEAVEGHRGKSEGGRGKSGLDIKDVPPIDHILEKASKLTGVEGLAEIYKKARKTNVFFKRSGAVKIEYIKRIVEQIVIAHDEYRAGMEELIDEVRKRLPEKDPITDRMLLSMVATTEMNSTLKQLLERLYEGVSENTSKPEYIELIVPDSSYWPFISTVLAVSGYIVDYNWVYHSSPTTEMGEPDPYYGQEVRHIIGRLKAKQQDANGNELNSQTAS